jgi:hypothetical protein
MELARTLPASKEAAELARPAIDLAVADQLPVRVTRALPSLSVAVLRPAVACLDARTVTLRVTCEPPAVRLEARWTSRDSVWPDGPAIGYRPRILAPIDELADRWGVAHRGSRRCLWAERFADADPRSWPEPPEVSAA